MAGGGADGPVADPVPEPPWGAFAPGALVNGLLWLAHATPLGRGGPRKLLYRAIAAAHAKPFDTRLWGAPVRLHPRHNVCENKALMRPDRLDPEEHALVRRHMAGPDRVMIDIGANAGLYCLSAALAGGPGSIIVSVEPNGALTRRLAFNMAAARSAGLVDPSTRLIPIAAAVSDRDGEAMLSMSDDEGGRSLTIERGDAGMSVVTRPLTAIVDEVGVSRIDVMKIDVEGHEDHVLPPYLANRDGRPLPGLIIIEHISRADWRPDCIALAREHGYDILATTRNNTMLTRAV